MKINPPPQAENRPILSTLAKAFAPHFILGYNISMRSKAASILAGHRLSGCLFALVLGLGQVYPAFASCICLDEGASAPEVLVVTGDMPSCHADPAESLPRETAEETDTKGCTSESHRTAGVSSEACCVSIVLWASEVQAAVSRNVETSSSLDAMYIVSAEDAGRRFVRSTGNSRLSEVGALNRERPPLYLVNASLLI